MKMNVWNAKIDYKFINKLNDEKLFINLEIEDFKENEQQVNEPQFKLRLSRHEKLFTNKTAYFLNTYLNSDENISCLFSGKNRRISLILNGCSKFSGYFVMQNNAYLLTPTVDQDNSYQVKLVEKREYQKCSYANFVPTVTIQPQKNDLNQIDVNVNIQKSLIYSLNDDTKALLQNLIANFHITSTYFNSIYDVNLKINSIKLVDVHTNKYLRLEDVKLDAGERADGLNVFIVDDKVSNDCFMLKSNVCDLKANKIMLKYDESVLKMSNNLIDTIINLLNKHDCLPNNGFHLLDLNANDEAVSKRCFVGRDYCTFVQTKATCGNGMVDVNEDCDCGVDNRNCDLNCCNAKTCKFHQDDYECSHGSCCSKCKHSKAGSICRPKDDGECDIEEKCDGLTAECPADVRVHDGVACEKGTCYSGKCANADSQCKLIWNENSASSDESCYKNFNTIGFQSGHCASSITAGKYDACETEDALCGLLNCQYGRDKPLISTESFFKSTTTIKENQFECKVVTNTSRNDLMYVKDGTRCSNDKVCVNRKCIKTPQLKCPTSSVNKKLCSGNGVCSSELNCVCNEKWTGPACDYYLNNDDFSYNNQTKIDFKSSSTLNTTSLLSIIAGFILIFLSIFVFMFLCNRRRRVRSLSASIDKLDSYPGPQATTTTTLYMDQTHNLDNNDYNGTNGSIKFGSLPSYKEYKMKNKSKTSLAPSQQTPTKTSNTSMLSCSDSISLTKLNNAIQKLNTQPCKSILKTRPNESQQDYYEEINNLNDTFTNTNLNAQYLTIFNKRASLTLSVTSSSTSSSSSSGSLTPTLNVPAIVEPVEPDENEDDEIDAVNIELRKAVNSNTQSFMIEANFQHKVQDYLNELNLLSKQNNFAATTADDISLLITPIKPIFSCENIILNTNNSETSSGYVSSSNGLIEKCINSNESIIYDDDHEPASVLPSNELRLNDKRYSYILATASTNNLSIDPE